MNVVGCPVVARRTLKLGSALDVPVPNWWILGAGALVLAIGALLMVRGVRLARLIGRLRRLDETPLENLDEPIPLVRTRGRLGANVPLVAPLTRRPAVYFFVKAQSVPEPGEKVKTLAAHKQWTPSYLETDEARVDLEPWTPLVASAHQDTRRFEDLTEVPDEHADLFEALGIEDKHSARLGTIDVTEYRFEPGDEARVVAAYEPHKGFYRAKRNPFIVSAFEDVGHIRRLRNELVLWTAIPPMLVAAGLAIVLLAFA